MSSMAKKSLFKKKRERERGRIVASTCLHVIYVFVILMYASVYINMFVLLFSVSLSLIMYIGADGRFILYPIVISLLCHKFILRNSSKKTAEFFEKISPKISYILLVFFSLIYILPIYPLICLFGFLKKRISNLKNKIVIKKRDEKKYLCKISKNKPNKVSKNAIDL